MEKNSVHWTAQARSATNQYPMGKAVGVAVLIMLVTALLANSFPTYGYGQTTFDPDGVRNLGSAIKTVTTWLVGGTLALLSLVVGGAERMRCRGAGQA